MFCFFKCFCSSTSQLSFLRSAELCCSFQKSSTLVTKTMSVVRPLRSFHVVCNLHLNIFWIGLPLSPAEVRSRRANFFDGSHLLDVRAGRFIITYKFRSMVRVLRKISRYKWLLVWLPILPVKSIVFEKFWYCCSDSWWHLFWIRQLFGPVRWNLVATLLIP